YNNNPLDKELNETKVNIKGVVQMSPYLQRADKYQAEKITNMTVIPDSIVEMKNYLIMFGIPEKFLDAISKPWEELTAEKVDKIRNSIAASKILIPTQQMEKNQDVILDPYMDQFMEKAFSEYFVKKAKTLLKKDDLTEKEMNLIHKKVAACISLTKGIRTFDILDRKNDLIWPEGIPVLILGAEKDTLVSPIQLKDFTMRLAEENIPFEFEVINDAGHTFPQTKPEEASQFILKFFHRILSSWVF
ncbi:MAG: alpha/beta hydrolase, partial [Bdellovibrionales bacterium]|nr:alpha/beta hydrolase [Bdellovibrionales bacterium]